MSAVVVDDGSEVLDGNCTRSLVVTPQVQTPLNTRSPLTVRRYIVIPHRTELTDQRHPSTISILLVMHCLSASNGYYAFDSH